jgi:hypothetical protein
MVRMCGMLLVVMTVAAAAPAALAAEGAPAPASGPPPATQTPALLPANLQALEQKMEELKITSMRFSALLSVAVPHKEHEVARFLKLLGVDSRISGEETISPPAGNVTFSLFGHPFKLRVVGGTTYLYLRSLARVDHGRPWVKLGPGGFFELFTVKGKSVKPPKTAPPKEPALAEPPFAGLRKALAGAAEVRELGAGTLYGQPVTNFLAILEPEQLKREHLASLSRLLPPRQPPTATLEVSLGQNGLPLRTVITEHEEQTTLSVTLDIPAINFPLVIEAPPAAQTISVAALRALGRRHRHRHSKRKK